MKRRMFEGRAGQPKVSVDHLLLEQFGEPQTDYDALDDLFFNTFTIPRKEDVPIVHLYQSRVGLRQGHHTFFSNTVHVNAAPRRQLIDPLPALLHEAKHMSDRYNRLPQLLGTIGLKGAIAIAPAELSEILGTPWWTVAVGGLVGVALHYALQDPLEREALAVGGDNDLLEKYAGIIAF
jgi:hypothetical protein